MAEETIGNNLGSTVTDLEIDKCMIYSAAGALDFKNSVAEFNYYEDIFSNFASGTLLLNDSTGAQNKLSWSGDEYLELEVNKPKGKNNPKAKPLKGKFRIYTNTGRHLTKDDNENLLINFVSEEMFISEKMKLSVAYKDMTIGEMVRAIALDYLKIPKEDFPIENVEKTLGQFHIVIPKLKPMEAINWLATKAISEKYGKESGASYVFWRDRNGYHFKSLISIFADVSGGTGNEKLTNQYINPFSPGERSSGYWYGIKNADLSNVGGNNSPVDYDPYMQIISYEVMNTFDTMEAHQRGVFANRVLGINYLSRTHAIGDFDYPKYFQYLQSNEFPSPFYKKDPKLDENGNQVKQNGTPVYEKTGYYNSEPIMSNIYDRANKGHSDYKESTLKIYPSSTTNPSVEYIKENSPLEAKNRNYIEHTLPYRYAQLSLFNHNRLKMVIPGDPYISVGKVIYVRIPQTAKGKDNKKLADRFLTGFYIVSAVRHKLDQENNFETILEIIKDSYQGRDLNKDGIIGLSSFDNSSVDVRSLVTNNSF